MTSFGPVGDYYAGKKLGFWGAGSKVARRGHRANVLQSELENLGVPYSRRGSWIDLGGPDEAMASGAFDELGYTKRLPSAHLAPGVQYLSEIITARRNQRIVEESRQMLLAQQQLMESRRPGGAQAMLSPLVSQAAGVNLQRQTGAPDLLANQRGYAEHKANRAASEASTRAIVAGGLQATGAVAGGLLGGPAGAVAGGAVGGAAGGAVQAAGPQGTPGQDIVEGPEQTLAATLPQGMGAPQGGGAAGAGAAAVPPPAGGPRVAGPQPMAAMGGPAPGGPGLAGGQPGAPAGPGAPAPMGGGGGAPGPMGMGGGTAGDVMTAMDPSPDGTLTGNLTELGPDATRTMAIAYDKAADDLGYDEWLLALVGTLA